MAYLCPFENLVWICFQQLEWQMKLPPSTLLKISVYILTNYQVRDLTFIFLSKVLISRRAWILLFIQQTLNILYVSGTVLSTRDSTVNKQKILPLWSLQTELPADGMDTRAEGRRKQEWLLGFLIKWMDGDAIYGSLGILLLKVLALALFVFRTFKSIN